MRINGFSGVNPQAETMGMAQANDSVSRNILNQIANAQKELQELSSNEEMSLEDKMKKRQEIQQKITNLKQQLRQHQMEQRKEQQSSSTSMDDMLAGTKNTSDKNSTGLSQTGMQTMLSEDASLKQAKTQGSTATQLEGRAAVLQSEIRQDSGRGNTEKKEAELADLQAKAQSATEAQMSTLADANKSVEEAAKADDSTEKTETKKDTAENTKQMADAIAENTTMAENIVAAENTHTAEHTGINPKPETTVQNQASEGTKTTTGQAVYTPIDIYL